MGGRRLRADGQQAGQALAAAAGGLAVRGASLAVQANHDPTRELVFGNEVLFGHDPEYDRHGRRGVAGYTVDAVLSALRSLGVVLPADHDVPDASAAFAGYVILDALVANTDRHHENWGILVDPTATEPPRLAPSFDHASSLGFLLSDDERAERLQTRDGEPNGGGVRRTRAQPSLRGNADARRRRRQRCRCLRRRRRDRLSLPPRSSATTVWKRCSTPFPTTGCHIPPVSLRSD